LIVTLSKLIKFTEYILELE